MSSPRSTRRCRSRPSSRAWRSAANCEKRRITGVSEICPVERLLPGQVRSGRDPPRQDAGRRSRRSRRQIGDAELELPTRIVEIPVLYNDPWTHETLMRFRERHQDPNSTDIEYAARINGYRSVDDFIAAHSGAPWFVSMVGFVAGLPFLYQMVERDEADRGAEISAAAHRHAEADRRPRRLLRLHLFGARRRRLSDVRHHAGADLRPGAGAAAISRTSWCLFQPGDIVKWKPITREEYDRDVKAVEAGTLRPDRSGR